MSTGPASAGDPAGVGQRPRVTAVLATHDRVETTLRCLRSLLAAAGGVDLHVVHVDDGSSDGTAAAVRELLPDVEQLHGDGALYWAGAMRIGLERAERTDPDHVLWLNDDVVLDEDALEALLDVTCDATPTIGVGALRDPDSGELTYSSVRRVGTWRGRSFELLPPGADDADAMNGNLVLVPRSARRRIGGFDPAYRHAIADYDYGLRAVERGVRIATTRSTVGTCARNAERGTWRDPSLPRRERLRLLNAPTGRPFREWLRFQRRNGGNWPVATLSPYLRAALTPPQRTHRGGSRPQVAIIYKSLPHYRVPLYERLRADLDRSGVDLRVLIGDPPVGPTARRDTAAIDWVESFPQREWRVGGRAVVSQRVLGRVRGCDLVVVEQASRLLVNNVFAVWRRTGGPALGLWGHGENRDQRHRSRLGEWWKRRVLTDCDWWFAYTTGTAAYVTAAGFPADRTTDLRNATDTTALQAAGDRLRADRDERATDPAAPPTVAFVGSLYAGKGLDDLVLTADRVREQVGGVEFVVVGDGEDRAVLDAAASTRPWFRLLGPRTGDALAAALVDADCVVCPAAVGLVVLDAFALGLPVVTAQADNHGPEIDYVQDGVNGLVVGTPAADPAFADAVVRVLEDADLRERLGDGARATAREFTIDAMAQRFADGIRECIGRQRTGRHRAGPRRPARS